MERREEEKYMDETNKHKQELSLKDDYIILNNDGTNVRLSVGYMYLADHGTMDCGSVHHVFQ